VHRAGKAVKVRRSNSLHVSLKSITIAVVR
jgi:hypothetical protein